MSSDPLSSIAASINDLKWEISKFNSTISGGLSTLESRLNNILDRMNSLIEEVQVLKKELEVTKGVLSTRIVEVWATSLFIEYISVRNRLQGVKGFLEETKKMAESAKARYREKYAEIINNYLVQVRDFLRQFLRIASNEFDVLRRIILLEKRIPLFYEVLTSGELDRNLLDVIFKEDMLRRTESVSEISSDLNRIVDLLRKASGVADEIRREVFPIDGRDLGLEYDELIIFFPIGRLVAQLGNERIVKDYTVSFEGNNLSLGKRALDYAGDKLKMFELSVDRDVLQKLKSYLVSEVARDDLEERLIADSLEV